MQFIQTNLQNARSSNDEMKLSIMKGKNAITTKKSQDVNYARLKK